MESVQDLHNLGNILEDFVCRNDLKRKHERDEGPTAQTPKKTRTVNCLDYEDYLERVGTFTHSCWSRNVLSSQCLLLPQHLARYGWMAKSVSGDGRFVLCISCRECLYLKLPPVTSSTYRSQLARQEERVSSGHAEFCPWSSSPSPSVWALPLSSPAERSKNSSGLEMYGTDLPWIGEDSLKQLGDLVQTVNTADQTQRVLQSAAVLAALGWQRGELEDTITDVFKVRRVGLWNFVSIQEELDRVEDIRMARELSGDSLAEDVSPKKKELEGKKYFDPIKEHLPWSPVVVKDENGKAGWQLIRDSFKLSEMTGSDGSTDTRSECSQTESDSVAGTVLRKVRALLELW